MMNQLSIPCPSRYVTRNFESHYGRSVNKIHKRRPEALVNHAKMEETYTKDEGESDSDGERIKERKRKRKEDSRVGD